MEETILELQAWVSTSSVWGAIKAASVENGGAGIPTCEDVSLPTAGGSAGGMGLDGGVIGTGHMLQSPLSHHRQFQIRSPMTGER